MNNKTLYMLLGLTSAPLMGADVPVTANITTNTTWTANNTYLLDKPIFVTNNATLTIEPGTVILGEENTGASTFGSLVITRGAKIMAEGTADKPIVFTARAERDGIDGVPGEFPDPAIGDASFWGGLILLGNAQVNNYVGGVNTGTNLIEGFPNNGDTGLITYGGGTTPNNADNSGVLRYVSIRFGGFEFAANNEINGLTLGGVGSGTTIDHIEVLANSDDGIEFFGGTVNTKHVAVAFCHDESFDIDAGHSGHHQFWFAIQNDDPALGDFGGEWDGGLGNIVTGAPETLVKIYNMTMIGTGSTDSGSVDDAINLSDAFAGTLANSVLHDFNGVALSNVGDGVESPKPSFLNNTWGSFGGGGGILANVGGPNAVDPAGSGNSAVGTDPQLRGISRIPNGGLDPRPTNNSPLLGAELAPFPAGAPAGFYEEVDYRGAFGTGAGDNWLRGWSYLDRNGYLASTDVPVTANITTNTTWTADNTYLLDKPIFVTNNATLTIEPGTVILGEENTGASTFGSLVITRGAKIMAEGTADKPIVFTARAERDGIDGVPGEFPDPAIGDASFWGGLILLGNAQVNNYVGGVNTGTNLIEGFPNNGDTGLITYGGGTTPNNADNSGVLRYVSIRFGGFEFAANNEINGLTLGGVGSGTTIDHIEVLANSDDGIEFFGGTVNTKHVAVAFCHDESFDIDAGHSGHHQFWFAIQNDDPALGDFGGEWDGGLGNIVTGAPETLVKIYNMTMIGTGSTDSGSVDDAINLSDAFAGTLANSVLHDFNGVALSNVGDGVESPKPSFLNNTWGSFGGGGGILANVGGPNAVDPAGSGNSAVGTNPQLVGISRIPNGGLDPRPNLNSPLYTSELAPFPAGAPAGFFETTNYRGAFGGTNWLKGWTYLSKKGYLTNLPDIGSEGGEPGEPPFADVDNDGISDTLEATPELQALGFTVGANDSALFDSIYTEETIQDLVTGNQVMVQRDGTDVTLSIPVFRSETMETFTEAPSLEATFQALPDKEFYRIEIPSAE